MGELRLRLRRRADMKTGRQAVSQAFTLKLNYKAIKKKKTKKKKDEMIVINVIIITSPNRPITTPRREEDEKNNEERVECECITLTVEKREVEIDSREATSLEGGQMRKEERKRERDLSRLDSTRLFHPLLFIAHRQRVTKSTDTPCRCHLCPVVC